MWEGGVRLSQHNHTQGTVYFRLYRDAKVEPTTPYAMTKPTSLVLTSCFFEITNSGDNIRAGMSTLSAGDDASLPAYADWIAD